MVKTFQNLFSVKNIEIVDLDKAAAIENDETMIINSDHTIITTPIESPQTDVDLAVSPVKSSILSRFNKSNEAGLISNQEYDKMFKDKKKRSKGRNESTRNSKYEKIILLFLHFSILCKYLVYLNRK